MTMGTRIVVMKDGFMQQVDTPMNLYDHPINQFVAGFIGTPQMNFFSAQLTGTKSKVCVDFGDDKIVLPKEKANLIVNLDKYLNTGREVILGIRPEDFHDDEDWVNDKTKQVIDVYVDIVEVLGSETLLYCSTKEDVRLLEEKTLDEETSNMIAKVSSRSTTKAGDKINVAIDVDHCHIFDKETEITIIAKDEAQKAEIEALQEKREAEEAEKAAIAAAKLAEEEAKAAAEAEKQRIKLEKKLAKQNAKNAQAVEEVVEEVAEETTEDKE